MDQQISGSNRDPQEIAYFRQLQSYWETDEHKVENFELIGSTDWQWPTWAEGLFVTSGPSKQEMNQTKFTHLFDGFGRLSSVNFRNGKAIYSSKLMDTDYYTRSLEKETVTETVLF